MTENCYYLGSEKVTLGAPADSAHLVQRLRQYLEVRNLTVLIGNGASIPLGAPLIGNVKAIADELDQPTYRLSDEPSHARATQLLDRLTSAKPEIGVEPLLAALANLQGTSELLGQVVGVGRHDVPSDDAALLERLLKKWLYIRCASLSRTAEDSLKYHEQLLRRILLRSTSLPRAKVFTLNYDLLLERALDNLGVLYFDGFLGTISRTLRSESYHYDLYYPGDTTEGRVSRVDRVLHLYKLHGSINWRRTQGPTGDVVISHVAPTDQDYGDVMVYPSPLKSIEMNGYPYAEMFRHFSGHIHQPQSVLFCIGYSFQDSHINRLIYQALSIPSFVLVIVVPTIGTPKPGEDLEAQHEVWRLIQLNSKRILVISGAERNGEGAFVRGAGTFQEFSTVWLPDITELAVDAYARKEARQALLPNRSSDDSEDT